MKKLAFILLGLSLLLSQCKLGNQLFIKFEDHKPSQSFGESYNGYMKNGKRLPSKGNNFEAGSHFLSFFGRNSVHSSLRKNILKSFDTLYKINPEYKFLYGECSWPNGGNFWPHYTHKNGLVVDFMVPVISKKSNKNTYPFTFLFNRWGYAFEFDSIGETSKYRIDFEAMATHLYFLDYYGKKNGFGIKRIIFEPDYLPYLYKGKYGNLIKDKFLIIYKDNWVKHDDHYHVEFYGEEKSSN